MEKNIKENIRKAIIDFDNKTFKVSEYGNIIGQTKKALFESLQSGDIDKASKDYEKFKKNVLVPYTEQAFNEVTKVEEDIIDEPIDFIEDNVDIGNTLFMKPITPIKEEVVVEKEKVVETKEEVESPFMETREFDFDGSFILPKEEFDFKIEKTPSEEEIKEEYKDLPMFTPEDQLEDTKEVTKAKTKKKSISFKKRKEKNAAYVDTVILCLIAQLSIFGLLIIVLLIIK